MSDFNYLPLCTTITYQPKTPPMKTSNDIPAGPFSEQELRELWNRQADEFNQWDSLDSDKKLAWAQTQALLSGGWIVPSIVNAQPSLANDDPIRAALERLVARLNETTDFGGPVPAWSDSFYAALATLKAEPASTGKDFLQVALPAEGEVAELVKELKEHAHHINEEDRLVSLVDNDLPSLLTRAADLLEQHQSAPAVETDAILALAAIIREVDGNNSLGAAALADAILSHRHSRWDHYPTPVPVSERLPGPEDCTPWPEQPNASPWCWMAKNVDDCWQWEQSPADYLVFAPDAFSHWLPAHALPLPTEEVEP